MALSILNNIPSMAAQNQLAITGADLQRTLFRLSSGSRINNGADDAAGLAIADGLEANVTALTQSSRNASDGVGKLQVADGALAQVTTLLNRAITLATESSNGTIADSQRTALDTEYGKIRDEIDRIGNTTMYNGTKVFTTNEMDVYLSDGGSSSKIGVQVGTLSSTQIGLLGGTASNTLSGIANANDGDKITIGSTQYKFVSSLTGAANEVLIGSSLTDSLSRLAAAVNGDPAGEGLTYGTGTVANADATAVADVSTITFTAKAAGSDGNSIASTVDVGGARFGFSHAATFDGGSDTAGLKTADAAQAALTTINNAIQTVAGMRGIIGAAVNRLQSAVNVINAQTQNLTSAEDGIRAADIASEVANLTKYSILNQTGISALAQANQMQSSVLKLLQ